MINLKDVVSDLKGDYIHALYYFIKDDLTKRGYPNIDDLHYDDFYLDVDSVFSLDELKSFCVLFNTNDDNFLLHSLICFFSRLSFVDSSNSDLI